MKFLHTERGLGLSIRYHTWSCDPVFVSYHTKQQFSHPPHPPGSPFCQFACFLFPLNRYVLVKF